MRNPFKRKPLPPAEPMLVRTYSISDALMMQEAIDFTLRECQRLLVKDRLDHGGYLLEAEKASLEKLTMFLGEQNLDFMRFVLKNEGDRRYDGS